MRGGWRQVCREAGGAGGRSCSFIEIPQFILFRHPFACPASSHSFQMASLPGRNHASLHTLVTEQTITHCGAHYFSAPTAFDFSAIFCWLASRGRVDVGPLAFFKAKTPGRGRDGVMLKVGETRRLQSLHAFLLCRSACLSHRSPPPPAPVSEAPPRKT